MTKAEERALEFLPSHPNEGLERQRKRFRGFYVDGYEQGQKDFAADPQETELNAEAYLTELGYTIIPPDAKFSAANVATLAKHLLVWAENAARDYALTPEDVCKIFNKVRELQVKYPATEACFEEVAEWFNEQRETDETKNC